MKYFFLSLKTTVWTLLALIAVFFLGSYLMPAYRDVHGGMNDRLLFEWVEEVAVGHPWATAWFFASLAGLVLLTVNTVVCSIQAVRGKWTRQDFLLRIAPQVVHAGFLLILLAHLLGAGWGYRLAGMVPVGVSAGLPDGKRVLVADLRPQVDGQGYLTGWSAEVVLSEGGARIASGTLGPNRPLFHGGTGVYLKSFEFQDRPMAYLMVNRDPGALWALAGSVLFFAGTSVIIVLKWRKA
jgi:hypothetical protein